jgi:hypothetical protein
MSLEELKNDRFIRETEDFEKIKNKFFLLENAIIERDNIIKVLKRKIEEIKNPFDDENIKSYSIKEVFITEPTYALNKLYNDLQIYKESFKNLSENLQKTKRKLERYEMLINVFITLFNFLNFFKGN